MDDPTKQRIDYLVNTLNFHASLYYTGQPLQINDYEYNDMYKELVALEAQYPQFIHRDTPTNRLGYLTGGRVVEHFAEMHSLDILNNEEQLMLWLKQFPPDTEIFYDLKHDGMPCELVYNDGQLVQASTRGDGRIGMDITHHALKLSDVSQFVGGLDREYMSVHGELTILYSSLVEINEFLQKSGRPTLPNPRQGIATLMLSSEIDQFILDRIKFNITGTDLQNTEFKTVDEFMDHYSALGFLSHEFGTCTIESIDNVLEYYHSYSQRKYAVDTPIDGVVIKLNNVDHWRQLGYNEKFPRFAKAIRFPEHVVTADIVSIRHAIGRIGNITPIAIIEPIQVDGITVSHVNLYNFNTIKAKQYYPGSKVELYRAGSANPRFRDVINNEHAVQYQEPTICPACRRNLVREGSSLFCVNPVCKDVIKARLLYAVSRECFNIAEINETILDALLKEDKSIGTWIDLLNTLCCAVWFFAAGDLDKKLEHIGFLILKGLGNSDPKIRQSTLKKFLMALSIPSLNSSNIDKIFTKMTRVKDLSILLYDYLSLRGCGISKASAEEIANCVQERRDEINKTLLFIYKHYGP